MLFYFFSSRRRHTRCLSDWSSDVCSSDLQMLGFVKDQQHLALTEIEPQVAQNPVDRSQSDCPAALGHPLYQVQGVDSLTNVDVVSSPAFTILGDLRAIQLRDQVLQDIGLLGSRGA